MRFDPSIFLFPTHLPNDLEAFIVFYPQKFPAIVGYYEKAAKQYFNDPVGFRQFIDDSFQDLQRGFEKIEAEFVSTENRDLDFLLRTDQRLQKLYAFRFWVINYLFADGPLHEYYVNNLRSYVPKIVTDTTEQDVYEAKLESTERHLLQGDHADIYLTNALNSVEMFEILQSDEQGQHVIANITDWLIAGGQDSTPLQQNIDKLYERIKVQQDAFSQRLTTLMSLPIKQSLFRKSREPIYQMFIQVVEFKNENLELQKRQTEIAAQIDQVFDAAKSALSKEEFADFNNCYQMAKLFTEAKDHMGNIDPVLLPFWYERLHEIAERLSLQTDAPRGPGAAFYEFVWHVAPEYKTLIFTPDPADFSVECL